MSITQPTLLHAVVKGGWVHPVEADYPVRTQNPKAAAIKEAGDGPRDAEVALPGLDTPAARDAMGAVADALEDAAKEVKRREVRISFISLFHPQ